MPKPDGGPAFPRSVPLMEMRGMSLRDWLAGQALTGVIGHPHATDGSPHQVAIVAYQIADAMLAEREREA